MNLHQLRTFATIAAEGSVTRAARLLHTSQPAVSKQLAELEEAVGTPLLDRLPRGVRLTEAGEILVRHAERIFAAERAAEMELAELSGLMRTRLSIGASTTIGGYLLPAAFVPFNVAHPRVKLELTIANTSAIQALVLDDRIDLGFTEGFVASEQLSGEAFYHDQMVAIASPIHRFAHTVVGASDLLRVPFIARERGSGTREIIEAALLERGVDLEPLMSLGSTEAIKSAVAAGLGLAIVSRLAVSHELEAGRLKVVHIRDLDIRRDFHVVRRKGKRSSPAIKAFMRSLSSSLAES
jgi:DNA-binding transcriptional LysR family regulator